MGRRHGLRGPPESRPPRPPRRHSLRSGLGPGCGSGVASFWRSPWLRPRRRAPARSRRRHCAAGFARTSRWDFARGPPSSRCQEAGDSGRGKEGGLGEAAPGSRATSALRVPQRGQKQESHHRPSRKKGVAGLLRPLEPSPEPT